MKRFIAILVGLLLISVIWVVGVAAEELSYDSTINIQNLDDVEGNLTITFYDEEGNVELEIVDTIPANGMKFYFVLQQALPENYKGSAIVAADVNLNIVHNLRINVGEQGAATMGYKEGGTRLDLPLVMRNNGGYDTWFSVQNAGAEDAEVRVNFYAGEYAGNDWTWEDGGDPVVVLKPGQAKIFDQDQMPELGEVFVGSAVVTGTQPLVASVVEVGPNGLFAYDAFSGDDAGGAGEGAGQAGSTDVIAPLFQYWNAGYQSSLQVQNMGDVPTEVTIEYTPGEIGGTVYGTACEETHEIQPGASEIFGLFAFYFPGNDCYDKNPGTAFVGSAHVKTNSAGQPLVAVVNQMNSVDLRSGAYSAFSPDDAAACVSLPLVMDRNNGYWTSINVFNPSETTPVTVTISYTEDAFGGNPKPADDVVRLEPLQMASVMNWGELGEGYVGSATACAEAAEVAGQKEEGVGILAMVNELNNAPWAVGDTLYVYNGFPIED